MVLNFIQQCEKNLFFYYFVFLLLQWSAEYVLRSFLVHRRFQGLVVNTEHNLTAQSTLGMT